MQKMMLSKTGTNFNLSFKPFINLKNLMTKYSKEAGNKVEKAMHEEKNGTLKSGRSGKIVTNPKQAIAIGLSEARKEGAKVPKKTAAK
jgi:hypothetical protein